MQLPEQLLKSMESVKGFDKEAFDKVHQSGEQVTSIRVNPAKRTEIKSQNSKSPGRMLVSTWNNVHPSLSTHSFMQVLIMCRKPAVCF